MCPGAERPPSVGFPPMDVDEADTANYQKANEPFLTAGAAMRVLPSTQTSTFSLITQRVINDEQNGCLLGRSLLGGVFSALAKGK